ncbi:hypothetical protein EOD23_08305 [Mesorhizobium sp. USDA-HM6]|nr:hypothetical protein EOD23_08305 [Mesorhizobium sp. USDA-HM6]
MIPRARAALSAATGKTCGHWRGHQKTLASVPFELAKQKAPPRKIDTVRRQADNVHGPGVRTFDEAQRVRQILLEVRFDYLVIVGGVLEEESLLVETRFDDRLRHAPEAGVSLMGLCTGSFILHRAGLMHGYNVASAGSTTLISCGCSTVSDRIFVVDRDRLTCSGGRAPISQPFLSIVTSVKPWPPRALGS